MFMVICYHKRLLCQVDFTKRGLGTSTIRQAASDHKQRLDLRAASNPKQPKVAPRIGRASQLANVRRNEKLTLSYKSFYCSESHWTLMAAEGVFGARAFNRSANSPIRRNSAML